VTAVNIADDGREYPITNPEVLQLLANFSDVLYVETERNKKDYLVKYEVQDIRAWEPVPKTEFFRISVVRCKT
jgi:hypothetical protein